MNTALSLVAREILLFWVLMIAGRLVDTLVGKLSSPETEHSTISLALVNIQIGVMMIVATYVVSRTSFKTKAPGAGILHAFAFLSTQSAFKKRVDRASKIV